MNRPSAAKIITLLLCILGIKAFSQHPQFRNYSVDEGLPQSQVLALIQCHTGHLWIGTKGGGLCTFDGENFNTFTTDDGLENLQIHSLYQDPDKIIWIGTGKGLYKYNGLKFEACDVTPNLETKFFAFIHDGNYLWAGSNRGLFYLSYGKWNAFGLKNHNTTINGMFKIDEELWIASNSGIYIIDIPTKKIINHFTKENGLPLTNITSIAYYNNKIVAATYGRGITFFENNKWSTPSLDQEIVHDVFVDDANKLWVATQNSGIYILQNHTLINHFNTQNGLVANHIKNILQDSWGNIWLGTSGGGIVKFQELTFKHFNQSDGFPGNKIYALRATPDSSILISIGNEGIYKYGHDSLFLLHPGLKSIKSKSLFIDKNKLIWIGTEGQGLYVLDSLNLYHLTPADGLTDNWIKDICEDSSGQIWTASPNGLNRILIDSIYPLRLSISKFQTKNGLPDNRVTCVRTDGQNRIWFGLQNGKVGYILGGQVVHFGPTEGLSSAVIKSIQFDKINQIWLATEGEGLFYASINLSFITFKKFGLQDGLNSNSIYLINFDNNGDLWVGAGPGIDRISFNQLGEIIEVKHFGPNDGFKGGETCTQSSTLSSDGILWIGTLNGMNCKKAGNSTLNTIPPIISIEDISCFYKSIKGKDGNNLLPNWLNFNNTLVFNPEQNHISILFNGVNLKNPKGVLFQYRLNGNNENWTPLGTNTEATFSNLSFGNYCFELKAVNEDGFWSEPISFSFEILTPLHRKTWFQLLLAFGVTSLAIVGLGIYFRIEKRKVKQAQHQLQLNKNLLELEQKTLRLQMNPHFLFNAMNTIQSMIGEEDVVKTRYYIAKFSKLMRKILENSRNTLISLSDELETIQRYLELENMFDNSFTFDLTIQPGLCTENYAIPPLILQPFVENALVHGIRGIAHKGIILISITLIDDKITISIRDNGKGRKAASEIRQQSGVDHKSTALIITQERLSLLHPDKKSAYFEITDLYPQGTEVKITIPQIDNY